MQLDLMQEVREAIGGRPLVLVLMSGGPVDISWAKVSTCSYTYSTAYRFN